MSVYEIVTEQVIKQLESGTAPWRKPWVTEAPCNLISQRAYRGINTFMLAGAGMPSKYWLTFNQATKLGGTIAKAKRLASWSIGTSAKRRSTRNWQAIQTVFAPIFPRV